MKALSTLTILPLLATSALLAPRAQEAAPQPLVPHADPHADANAPDDFDADAWKRRLRSPDLRERMGTFDELVRAARSNASVRAELGAWAQDERELELAWTAQLALRELERADAANPPRGQHWRGDVFGDPFADPFRGFGGFGGGSLDQLFDQLRHEMESLRRGALMPPRALQGLPQGSFQSSKGFRMEQTPEGVKIEITEQENGDDVTRTYEGATLEELLEANPELKEHVQIGPGAGFPSMPWSRVAPLDPFGRGDGAEDMDDFFSRPPIPGQLAPLNGAPRTDRLGVQVREPVNADEVGLTVAEVLRGSLAEAVGVRAGDVLTKLNGAELRSVDDVKRVLAERAADEPIVLELVGQDGRASTLTWRPEAAATNVKPGRKV